MDALPNIIPKSIIEALNRLENDVDNQYSWKLTRNQDSLSLTVSCKLPAKTPNKAKDDSEVAGRPSVKPVRCSRKKRNSPSALARSRRRHAHFLEKKLAEKPDSSSPEDQQDSVCVKELEKLARKPDSSSPEDQQDSVCVKELEKLAGKPDSSSPEDQQDSVCAKELEKLAGKPDSSSPEDQQDSVCVKELEKLAGKPD